MRDESESSDPLQYSSEVKKTEALTEVFWRAIGTWLLFSCARVSLISKAGLQIKWRKEAYEGERTKFTPAEAESPLSGYGPVFSLAIHSLSPSLGDTHTQQHGLSRRYTFQDDAQHTTAAPRRECVRGGS
jgi:DNA helicase TIP49 (TBP-interacting protein)